MSLSAELHTLPPQLASTYELQNKLGFGSFAIVYQVRHRSTGELLALKVVDKLPLEQRQMLESMYKEVNFLQLHAHTPNVVRLRDSLEANGRFFLIFDLYGQNMFEVTTGQAASEQQALEWTREVCEGLSHLHSAGVVHRDLKPANLLMDSAGQIRICDFGYACNVSERRTDPAGTREYAAPEVMNMQCQSSGLPQTTAADIYSLGTCLQHFLLGRIPAGPHDIPPHVSAETKQLLTTMLQVDPVLRPTAEDLLEQLDPQQSGFLGQFMAYFNLSSSHGEHSDVVGKMGPTLSMASTMAPSSRAPSAIPGMHAVPAVSSAARLHAASGQHPAGLVLVPTVPAAYMPVQPLQVGHRRMRTIS
mmetsp:Transcript_12192/g.22483  ORF Transcript_12192/g.22483 Transcript_12192/m.22483 type:complete len:361 (-) Transcript_12192:240-1322(-)